MSTDPLLDEDYASEEDSDFAIDETPAGDASEASDSEDDSETAAQTAAKRKRAGKPEADDDGYDNSGDEAIITKGKKRQKKKKDKSKDGTAVQEDDEGGEGGLIKTRSMRANETAERKAAAISGPVTVDVDDLWAQMMAGPIVPSKAAAEQDNVLPASTQEARNISLDTDTSKTFEKDLPEMIKIKRTYNFAGKVHTEEKMVARDSAEAKVYLASLGDKADAALATEDEPTKRKPRKAFRSMFEPVLEGVAQRTDLNLGMTVRLQIREQAKAKKLNVVEKSRMDWAGFVDKEGIQDDLKLAGKSKESFASRQDFLARVEAKRDDDARKVRMTGRA